MPVIVSGCAQQQFADAALVNKKPRGTARGYGWSQRDRCYDRAIASKELVVETHLEDMLIGTYALSESLRSRLTRRAVICEADVFGIKTQIIVFKLSGPVIGEGIFQTDTD